MEMDKKDYQLQFSIIFDSFKAAMKNKWPHFKAKFLSFGGYRWKSFIAISIKFSKKVLNTNQNNCRKLHGPAFTHHCARPI